MVIDVGGGADMEWYFTIFPRIHSFVPVDTILEIGPGRGRWSQYLVKLCKRLILVDLSENCIKACKERFRECLHVSYFVNDGKALNMVADESIDFVFSFDSLVHAEEDAVEPYLNQLASKMKRRSVGFIHHSNAGSYKTYFSMIDRIKNVKIKRRLIKFGMIEPSHWHAYSLTADKFREYIEKAELQCISQEIINCDTKRLIGCISVFTKDVLYKRDNYKTVRNVNFAKEAKLLRNLSEVYGPGNEPKDESA